MAEVIREGGANPLQVKTWQDAVSVAILEQLHDRPGRHVDELWHDLKRYLYTDEAGFLAQWKHKLIYQDVELLIGVLLTDGYVRVSEWKCACCATTAEAAKDPMAHALRFSLTHKGYDAVPEHIFP